VQRSNGRCAEGRNCTFPVASLHFTGIEQRAGESTSGQGVLHATTQHLVVDARLADFVAATGLVPSLYTSAILAIASRPFGKPDDAVDEPWSLSSSSLLIVSSQQLTSHVLSIDYHDPYPSAWPRALAAGVVDRIEIPVGGNPFAMDVQVQLRTVVPLAEAQSGPIVPIVGPPRHVEAEARPGGLQVAWDPPELGHADGYIVSLFGIADELAEQREVARYYTVATSLVMIPETLDPVLHGVVRVTAVSGEDIDLLHAPHRRGFRYGTADAISAPIVFAKP
jgi:hypothetical protein